MVVVALSGGMAPHASLPHAGPAALRELLVSRATVSRCVGPCRRHRGGHGVPPVQCGVECILRGVQTLLCLCGSVKCFDVTAGCRRPRAEHVARSDDVQLPCAPPQSPRQPWRLPVVAAPMGDGGLSPPLSSPFAAACMLDSLFVPLRRSSRSARRGSGGKHMAPRRSGPRGVGGGYRAAQPAMSQVSPKIRRCPGSALLLRHHFRYFGREQRHRAPFAHRLYKQSVLLAALLFSGARGWWRTRPRSSDQRASRGYDKSDVPLELCMNSTASSCRADLQKQHPPLQQRRHLSSS